MNNLINYPKIIDDFLQKEDIEDTEEIISAYTLETYFREENKKIVNLQRACNDLTKKINENYTLKDKIKRIVPGNRLIRKEIKSIKLKIINNEPMLVIELIPLHKDKLYQHFNDKNINIIRIIKRKNSESLEASCDDSNGLIVINNYQDYLSILSEAETFLEKYENKDHEEREFLPFQYGTIYCDDSFEIITEPGLLISKTCKIELRLINGYFKLNSEEKNKTGNKIIAKKSEILKKIPLKINSLPQVYQNIITYYQSCELEKGKVRTRKLGR